MSRYRELEKRVAALETQLEEEITTVREIDYSAPWSLDYALPLKTQHAVTLRGKIEAICRHLGLDIGVEQRVVTGPSVKVKKVKKGKK